MATALAHVMLPDVRLADNSLRPPIAYAASFEAEMGWVVRDFEGDVWFISDDPGMSVRILDRSDGPKLDLGPPHQARGLLAHVEATLHATEAVQRH